MRETIEEINNRYGEKLRIEIVDNSKSHNGAIDMKLINNSDYVCSECSFHTYGIENVDEVIMKLVTIDSLKPEKKGYGTILLENGIKELLLEFDVDLRIEGEICIQSPSSQEKLIHFYRKFFYVKNNSFDFGYKRINRNKDVAKLNFLIEKEKTTCLNREVSELNSKVNMLKNEIEELKELSLIKFLIVRRRHKKLKE
ncbi:hypothetical protein [Carnobacterium maltaromaticum]|uniref:hypothetical protein n=1 Tax=Carnobacterium maltaromaticum TaxID=2751 RepID=UPI0012F90143|nr:hypothetical protein [Carnobacterium maltaromaticum]